MTLFPTLPSISLFHWRWAPHLETPVSGSAQPPASSLAATVQLITDGQSHPRFLVNLYPLPPSSRPGLLSCCLLSWSAGPYTSHHPSLVCSPLQPVLPTSSRSCFGMSCLVLLSPVPCCHLCIAFQCSLTCTPVIAATFPLHLWAVPCLTLTAAVSTRATLLTPPCLEPLEPHSCLLCSAG